jgi:uncharacterized membrane protein YphA (DoxX/SURF4 family)
MADALYALGRIAVVLFFLLAGINMLSDIDATRAVIDSQILAKLPSETVSAIPVANLAQITAIIAGVLAVIASVLVIFGYWTRFAAFILLAGLIIWVIFSNDILSVDVASRLFNQAQLFNLTLAGGLLMLLGLGAGGLSVDGRSRAMYGAPIP